MFFISEDLEKKNKNNSLKSVIDDNNTKVAYGVLGIGEYLKMVKHIGDGNFIFIPKVQRGLKWDVDQQERFINKCITGIDGVLEPMPNIFLFYDEETGETQLFDGLQRTKAMLSHFEDNEVKNQVMIPTALFKGTREEAEDLFRHINDRGVKLNDFEKLASFGARYPIKFLNLDKSFKTKFNIFTKKMNEQYLKAKFSITKDKDISLYELLVYSIYSFADNKNAKKLFKVKSDYKLIDEWGFQIAYSSLTKNKSKKYTKTLLLNDILKDFASEVNYDRKNKTFSIEKTEQFIEKMTVAIANSEKVVRDIYSRNINVKSMESLSLKAITSNALVSSLVVAYYLNPYLKSEVGIENMRNWYLTQLINERPSKLTNLIIDEILKVVHETQEDFRTRLNNAVVKAVSDPESKTSYSGWLWTLYVVQYNYIKNKAITKEFDIDHIIPKSILQKIKFPSGDKVFLNESINGIGNLALITRTVNQNKKNLWLSDLPLVFKTRMKDKSQEEIEKVIQAYNADYRDGMLLNEHNYEENLFEKRNEKLMFYTKMLKEAIDKKDYSGMSKQFNEIKNLRVQWMKDKFSK